MFIFLSPLSICTSTVSLFLASLSPSIYGAAFERMFNGSLSVRHYKTVHDHPFIEQMSLTLFVLLDCNCSLSSAHSVLQSARSPLLSHFKLVSILIEHWVQGSLAFPPSFVQTPFSASTANTAESFLNRALLSQAEGMELCFYLYIFVLISIYASNQNRLFSPYHMV